MLPLLCQSLFIFSSPTCLFLLWLPVLLVSQQKKSLSRSMLRNFPPMLSVKSYVYVFNSFLRWFFVYGARERLNLIVLDVDTQSSPSLPSSFIRDYSFPIVYSWHPCWKSAGCMPVGLFLEVLFCSIGLCVHLTICVTWENVSKSFIW